MPIVPGEGTEVLAAYYTAIAEGLVQLNLVQMQLHQYPPLLASGVRYRREPRGSELWSSVSIVYLRGYGDCEDLAAIVVAEARLRGKEARVVVRPARNARGFHAVAEVEGKRYDPSRALIRRERERG